jgi:hypothetical protein
MIDEFLLDEIKPKKEFLVDRDLETDIFKRISKSLFIEELEKMKFDLELVSNGRRNKNEHFHKFNLFIKRMNTEQKFSMCDMFIFMEEDYFDTKTVMGCLNEENIYVLREEASIRFNRKQKKSRLTLLIEE